MKKTLHLAGIKGAIFDIDGTMINNGEFHKKAFAVLCEKHQLPFSDEIYQQKVSGRSNRAILPALFGRELSEEEIAEYSHEKEALYRELYAPFIQEITGLRSLILGLKERGILLAITTGAAEKNRQFVFDSLNLHGLFDVVIGDEHIHEGKPHPEGYLKTIAALNLPAEQCIIFEDAPPGVEAAVRSGVKTVVAILSGHSPEELKDASFCVEHFNQIELAD